MFLKKFLNISCFFRIIKKKMPFSSSVGGEDRTQSSDALPEILRVLSSVLAIPSSGCFR